MAEVLSQGEIDSLLNALSTGQVQVQEKSGPEQKVQCRRYDFRRPNKFSKSHLRVLQMLHDSLGRLLTSFLTDSLRQPVYVRVASMEQFTFEEFVASVPTPTLLTVFTMPPLLGVAIMETNPLFLFPILDIFFGGTGEMPRKARDFTELELSVIRKLDEHIMDHYAMAWRDVTEVKAHIESLESNPQLYQFINPAEIVAVITLTTVIGPHKGLINLCLPFVLIDPVISRLQENPYGYDRLAGAMREEEQGHLRGWLGLSEMEITVAVGSAEISVQEFLHLQAGDVLTLDRRLDQDLDLLVGGLLKYKVQAGTVGRRLAVQVTSLAGEGVVDV
ncbi:MAG: flagellar motor switch protein FliM [Peptococcaceae bacterium]|nr:flagellar motor switch protein FliM [Peptococcaceae bacterium]